MRRLSLLCGLLALGTAFGQEKVAWDASASLTGTGYYLFRGVPTGPAGLFADASLTASRGDWSASALIWNYTQLDRRVRAGEWDYDLSVSWAKESVPVGVTAGWVYYDVPGGIDTQEAYLSLGFDTLASPYVTAYYDFDNLVGLHVRVGGSHEYDLRGRWSASTWGSVGFDFGRGIDSLTDFNLGLGLTYNLWRGLDLNLAADLVVPNHQVGTYGARINPLAGVSYSASW